jgi:hypothetical protein
MVDSGARTLEIVAGAHFAVCLVNGIGDFMEIDFRDGIEGWHIGFPRDLR